MSQVVDYIENWRARDKAEWLAEGEAKGRVEGEISLLKRLLGGGLSIDSIAQALGISVVEVRRLAAGNNNVELGVRNA